MDAFLTDVLAADLIAPDHKYIRLLVQRHTVCVNYFVAIQTIILLTAWSLVKASISREKLFQLYLHLLDSYIELNRSSFGISIGIRRFEIDANVQALAGGEGGGL